MRRRERVNGGRQVIEDGHVRKSGVARRCLAVAGSD
jgi:hypothetical protein